MFELCPLLSRPLLCFPSLICGGCGDVSTGALWLYGMIYHDYLHFQTVLEVCTRVPRGGRELGQKDR